jgi:hypothetical protein
MIAGIVVFYGALLLAGVALVKYLFSGKGGGSTG